MLLTAPRRLSGEMRTQVAPQSVKSFGEFEDILASDNPDVWESHKPAEGGAAGKMLQQIIEKAARLKLKRAGGKTSAKAKAPRGTKVAKNRKLTRSR